MGTVGQHNGVIQRTSDCACGATRLSVMVPASTFFTRSTGAKPEMRPNPSLDVLVCARCDGGTSDDIHLGFPEEDAQ